MSEIISVIGAVIVGFVGVLAPMLNRDLRQNRMTVLELFIGYAVAVLTVIVLVFVLLRAWYLFAIEFGYPIFPTWPRRTTFDWLLDAVVTTVSVAVYACLYVHEFYARTNDCKYLSSEARHKKWTTVAWAYGAVALISFLYQLFKYYPNPW